MVKKYRKSSTELFSLRLLQQVSRMKSELHKHRYYLEQSVARRTECLTRRIEVLEACNAALCSKLASNHESPENRASIANSTDRVSKIRIVNAQAWPVLRS